MNSEDEEDDDTSSAYWYGFSQGFTTAVILAFVVVQMSRLYFS